MVQNYRFRNSVSLPPFFLTCVASKNTLKNTMKVTSFFWANSTYARGRSWRKEIQKTKQDCIVEDMDYVYLFVQGYVIFETTWKLSSFALETDFVLYFLHFSVLYVVYGSFWNKIAHNFELRCNPTFTLMSSVKIWVKWSH